MCACVCVFIYICVYCKGIKNIYLSSIYRKVNIKANGNFCDNSSSFIILFDRVTVRLDSISVSNSCDHFRCISSIIYKMDSINNFRESN